VNQHNQLLLLSPHHNNSSLKAYGVLSEIRRAERTQEESEVEVEGGSEGRREGAREGGREGGRERGKEGASEGGRDVYVESMCRFHEWKVLAYSSMVYCQSIRNHK